MFDVQKSPELQAALLALKVAEREIRLDVNKDARGKLRPIWQQALAGRGATSLESRVIVQGATVSVGAKQITLKAATSKRPLSGGLVPASEWQGAEFGMTPKARTFTTHSSRGKAYTVTRQVGAQFRARTKHGRIAFDAASTTATALVGIWVRTVVDKFRSFADIQGGR